MAQPIIKDPFFVDLEKTTVRMKLVNDNGVESIAEFKVPEDQALGVNPYWDRIVEEFDVEKMREDRNILEKKMRQEQDFRRKKDKAAVENEKLRKLFDAKMECFSLPFIANASDEDKAVVRRAPDLVLLNMIVTKLADKYMNENNMSYIELFDMIDDMQDE